MNLLFICSQNRLRSPTAEACFAEIDGLEAASAGTNPDAITPVSTDLIEWADVIFVMEAAHQKRLQRKFTSALRGKRIVNLNVPDEFKYMQPELTALILRRTLPHLRLTPAQEQQLSSRGSTA